jgi:hypothetical protein
MSLPYCLNSLDPATVWTPLFFHQYAVESAYYALVC